MVRYLINYSKETNEFTFGNLKFESLEAVLDYYSQGRSSACFLVKPAPKERLLALYDFAGEKEEDLPLSKGDMVAFVIQKKDWILCSFSDGRRGWAPANHLAPVSVLVIRSCPMRFSSICFEHTGFVLNTYYTLHPSKYGIDLFAHGSFNNLW